MTEKRKLSNCNKAIQQSMSERKTVSPANEERHCAPASLVLPFLLSAMTQRKEFMDELRAFGESFSTRPGGTLILHTLGAIAAPSTANTDDDHDSDNRRSAPRESGLRVNVLMLGGSDGAYRGWSKTFDFKFLNAQVLPRSPATVPRLPIRRTSRSFYPDLFSEQICHPQ